MPKRDRICAARDILKYLDGKIEPRVEPERDCGHCTYAETVEALDGWMNGAPSGHDLFV